eukprot:101000_1
MWRVAILAVCIVCGQYDPWYIGSTSIPRGQTMMATASWNGRIVLLGGNTDREQFISFNQTTKIFTDHGQYYLSVPIRGAGQFYSQINSQLYVIESSGTHFGVFDLLTDLYTTQSPVIPIYVSWRSCIAAHSTLLAVVGGVSKSNYCLNTLFMLNISQTQSYNYWVSGPNMTIGRAFHACIVHPKQNKLYAIAGISGTGNTHVKSVEEISVHNILFNRWEIIGNLKSNVNVYGIRCVIVGDNIVVFGDISTDIHVIHTNDNNTLTPGGALNYSAHYTATLISMHTIYAFGPGENWQYFDLPPTRSPTQAPTIPPTPNNYELIALKILFTFFAYSHNNSLFYLLQQNKYQQTLGNIIKNLTYSYYHSKNFIYTVFVSINGSNDSNHLSISYKVTNIDPSKTQLYAYLCTETFSDCISNETSIQLYDEHVQNMSNAGINHTQTVATIHHEFTPKPIDVMDALQFNNSVTNVLLCFILLLFIIMIFAIIHQKKPICCNRYTRLPITDNFRFTRFTSFIFAVLVYVNSINVIYTYFYAFTYYNYNIVFLVFFVILLCICITKVYINISYLHNNLRNDLEAVRVEEHTKEWINNNMKKLMLFIFMSGSLYDTILLQNCSLFGLSMFTMNLTDSQLKKIDKVKKKHAFITISFIQLMVHTTSMIY